MYPNDQMPQQAPRRRRSDAYQAAPQDQQPRAYSTPGRGQQTPSTTYAAGVQAGRGNAAPAQPRRAAYDQQHYDAPRGVPQMAAQPMRQPRYTQQEAYPAWQNGPASYTAEQPWEQPQAGYASAAERQARPRVRQGSAQRQNAAPRQDSLSQQQYFTGGYFPPQPPYGQGGEPPHSKGRGVIAVLVIALVLLAAGVCGYYALRHHQTQQYVEAYNSVFVPGVYVDGLHLGGMTQEEGVNAVTQQAQQRSSAWHVRLMYQGNLVAEINAGQLGLQTDVLDTLRDAWNQGHTGDIYQRKEAMEALAAQHYEGYTAMPSGDTSVIDSILEEVRGNVYRAPRDAAIVAFDPNMSYPFTFQDEVVGRSLDTAPIKEQLYQMVSTLTSGDIEIEPQLTQPNVFVHDLRELVMQLSTASTPISKDSTENRTNNIRRSFQSINGYILQPGSTFSFNGVVGQRTTKNGFFKAIEYAYGEPVEGVGGGVCQASTTVYQAAVKAGLEIIKREPHSDSVSYSEYGMDATVYWEGNRKIDMSFRNSTDSPIYMVAGVFPDPSNHKRLVAKVTFYGKSLGDVSYGLEAKTVQTLNIPDTPKYIKDKNQVYVTYKDEEKQTSKGKKGYVVESYRIKYVNNHEVERTLLYTDRYEAKPKVVYVGTQDR